jgi:alkylated DNA repair dioxygenase AlkB
VLRALPLAGAELAWDPTFLVAADAAAAFATLRDAIAWERHRIRLFGRDCDVPRLSCWIGDADAHYRYSGTDFEPRPWSPALLVLRERIEAACDASFNSVLANLYRDGRDSMGWHSDDEPELGPSPLIASLSLGASRRFLLRHRDDPAQRLALELGPGSLLVMRGATQANHRHALPRTARAVGERINLTFRWVRPRHAG